LSVTALVVTVPETVEASADELARQPPSRLNLDH
jgi:hypothetical protein